MKEAPSIPRRPEEPAETDFDGLRADGIGWLERLGGERWTDYNLHDPGITILEHLCFGLTDLLYRVGFDVEDHLTGPDGALDFAGQGLHRPEDILPCRPATPEDYRRTILACMEEVDDAWIQPLPWPGDGTSSSAGSLGGCGLMRVILRPSDSGAERERKLLNQVQKLLSEARNLAEDVESITVARLEDHHLAADVDVAGSRPLSEILVDIHRSAEDYVAGRPRPLDPYRALDEHDATLDRVLTGPRGCGGRPLIDDPDYDPENLFIADLLSRIQAVDGVVGVRNLRLVRDPTEGVDGENAVTDRLPRYAGDPDDGGVVVPRLVIPGRDWGSGGRDGPGVQLWRRGEALATPLDFSARYQAARRGHRLDRLRGLQTPIRLEPPVGVHRTPGRYRSLQQHFPAVYGINEEGVPDSETAEAWLSAFRLKAYLLLPEQLMANYLSNLANLREFFSPGSQGAGEDAGAATYRTQALGPAEIPGFERFYGETGPPEEDEEGGFGPYHADPGPHLAKTVAAHDDTVDRRSRLQDHMLAIFGESLAPRAVAGPASEQALDEPPARLIQSRARLLRDIPRVTRDRGGAFDHLAPAPSPSGFKRRVALLLGVRPGARFHVVEHVLLRPSGEDIGAEAWRDFYGLRVSVFFPGWPRPGRTPASHQDFRRRAEAVVAAQCPAHIRADCHWLSKERMEELESLLRPWRRERRTWLESRPASWAGDQTSGDGAADGSATELVRFVWSEAGRRGD